MKKIILLAIEDGYWSNLVNTLHASQLRNQQSNWPPQYFIHTRLEIARVFQINLQAEPGPDSQAHNLLIEHIMFRILNLSRAQEFQVWNLYIASLQNDLIAAIARSKQTATIRDASLIIKTCKLAIGATEAAMKLPQPCSLESVIMAYSWTQYNKMRRLSIKAELLKNKAQMDPEKSASLTDLQHSEKILKSIYAQELEKLQLLDRTYEYLLFHQKKICAYTHFNTIDSRWKRSLSDFYASEFRAILSIGLDLRIDPGLPTRKLGLENKIKSDIYQLIEQWRAFAPNIKDKIIHYYADHPETWLLRPHQLMSEMNKDDIYLFFTEPNLSSLTSYSDLPNSPDLPVELDYPQSQVMP